MSVYVPLFCQEARAYACNKAVKHAATIEEGRRHEETNKVKKKDKEDRGKKERERESERKTR